MHTYTVVRVCSCVYKHVQREGEREADIHAYIHWLIVRVETNARNTLHMYIYIDLSYVWKLMQGIPYICMCVYIYMYIHICIHACRSRLSWKARQEECMRGMRVYIRVYVRAWVCICVRLWLIPISAMYVRLCVRACMRAWVCVWSVCVNVSLHTCAVYTRCVCLCVCACARVCVSLYVCGCSLTRMRVHGCVWTGNNDFLMYVCILHIHRDLLYIRTHTYMHTHIHIHRLLSVD
jgi:hypothetical protein